MRFTLFSLLASTAPVLSLPSNLTPRQSPSTTWQYCPSKAAPGNFKAFSLPSCTSQLNFTKDQYIGVQWQFEATYADGSKSVLTPLQSTNFAISDTFYPYPGNNFLTRLPGSSAHTAVFEFTNTCKNGAQPVSWRFYTSKANSACSSANYRYTTGQISAVSAGARPAKVGGVSARRTSDDGTFTVSWSGNGASAYSVIVQYPSGEDELGNPYYNNRGARVQGTSTTVATTTRRKDVARKVVVHAVNSQGLWSYANDVQPISAGW